MKKLKNMLMGLYPMTVGSIILIMIMFSIFVQLIGYVAFTSSFSKEYEESVSRVNELCLDYMDGYDIKKFLKYTQEDLEKMYAFTSFVQYEEWCEEKGEELDKELYLKGSVYGSSKELLSTICNTMNMSVIYAIIPDSDYKNYTCIFNCVNDDSGYEPWELGRRVETPEEYYDAYRNIYEKDSKIEIVKRYNNLGSGRPHITGLSPLKNEDGNIVGILCVQRYTDELELTIRTFIQGTSALSVIAIIIILVLESIFLKKQVIKPIDIMAKEAKRFAEGSETDVTPVQGSLSADICKVNEISSLAESISIMETDTIKRIEHISAMTMDKQRIESDLNLASKIQMGMLPQKDQLLDDYKEFDIAASMRTAKEVGGDFYDFFMVDDTHLAILIADVSDKGFAAAFFMAISKTLIKARARLGGSAADIIEYVDGLISEKNPQGMFVTVWFGIIDIRSGHMDICNAGHDYPAIMQSGGDYKVEKMPHGPAVGFIPGAKHVGYEADLKPGDRIFLYTDGLNEAKRSDGERYGIERMLKVLNSNKNLSNEMMIEKISDEVKIFAGDEPQFDDMTILSFTYNG
ncbi:MAG: PP2C family protein-serine/threonine phosphatase [Eubacterium sp.]|nr:PP2C family protein-serine/threonine phosphatase [Eubacterium sp.]